SEQLVGGAQASAAPTKDPAAYDLYLKGQLGLHRLGPASTVGDARSVDALFSEAIKRDPNFGLAYLGRAVARSAVADFGTPAFSRPDPKVIRAATEDLDAAERLSGKSPALLASRLLLAHFTSFEDPKSLFAIFDSPEAAEVTDSGFMIFKGQAYGNF